MSVKAKYQAVLDLGQQLGIQGGDVSEEGGVLKKKLMNVVCIMFYLDTVRELLTHVPAGSKSELPATPQHAIAMDLSTESDLTPLHLAAYSGSENVVRALLNSSGVQVDAGSNPSVS